MPGSYQKKNPASSFPAPKYFRVRDNPKRKNAICFFDYWAKLPLEKTDCALVKVYRTWPRVDLRLVNPERTSIAWDFIDGPIPFDPKDYRHTFLKRYGSGSWLCQMYETQTESGLEIKVSECFFDAEDLENVPPQVDLRTVLWSEPGNQRYIGYLRQRSIRIPGESNAVTEAQAQEMALVAQLAKALLDQNARLVDRLLCERRSTQNVRVRS